MIVDCLHKTLRQTADALTCLLKCHNFSDTSVQTLVPILVSHALNHPDSNSYQKIDGALSDAVTRTGMSPEVIAVLCSHLKCGIRWHAPASRSAAFQMALSAQVNGKFYREWDTTSQTLSNCLAFLSFLSTHAVLPIQNLFHASLHVSRSFTAPSHLQPLVRALETSRASHSSEVDWEALIEKVTGRLDELGVELEGSGAGREEEAYRNVMRQLRAIAQGAEEETELEERRVTDGDRHTEKMGIDLNEIEAHGTAHMLESIVQEVELAVDMAEKTRIGKSKAKV